MSTVKRRVAGRPSVHLSIDVPNLKQGLRFYREVFGFIETARPFPTMAIMDANNVTVCMHEKASGTQSSAASMSKRHYERHWTPVHLDLHVEDFDSVLAKVRSKGGAVEAEFRNHGPKLAGFCCDPFGNGFCVIGERESTRVPPGKTQRVRRIELNGDIKKYNARQTKGYRGICETLAKQIAASLTRAESKIWHGAPVWFIDGNPVVGYWVRKEYVQLLFWSGQSFDEPALRAEGKFKAAELRLTEPSQLDAKDMKRWLKKARTFQWDYKNIVKRRGALEKIGTW